MATKKRRKADRKWKHRRVLKATFLTGVRQRLLHDVGPYLEAVEGVRVTTGRGVGFWALPRMLFPVVEAVSTALYRTSRRERPPVRLLRELGFEYPNLVWEMYRHTLMHNDEMASALYMGRRIAWSIGIGNGHSWSKGRLGIDAKQLYEDLLAFLSRLASEPHSKKVHVWVGECFRFNTGFSRATRDEALSLGTRACDASAG
jgi:hypothetical protein